MLKSLAMLVLLILCMNSRAWSQVPRDGSGQHDKAQDKQETANPSKPVVVVDSQHGANNQEQPTEKPTKYPRGELLAPANVPNWFLVAVGAVTGWFVYKTLKAIKRQADIMEKQAAEAQVSGVEATKIALATAQAAQKSADAALLNAQAVINAERPWIVVEIKDVVGPMGGFFVHVRNKGRTPAMITAAYMGCVAVKEFSDLPEKAPHGVGNLANERIVISGESAQIIWFSGSTLRQMLNRDLPAPWDGRVFVCGKVLYRDLLNTLGAADHETRWISIYEGPGEHHGEWVTPLEGMGDMPEYDRYT